MVLRRWEFCTTPVPIEQVLTAIEETYVGPNRTLEVYEEDAIIETQGSKWRLAGGMTTASL